MAIRLTPQERAVYQVEAEKKALSLGEWIRQACSAAMSPKNRLDLGTIADIAMKDPELAGRLCDELGIDVKQIAARARAEIARRVAERRS